MAEEIVYDGVGASITFGTTAETFVVEKLTPPGWARKIVEMTALSNTGVTTKKLGKLKDFEDFPVTVQLDPDKTYNTNFASNELITITFPDSLGALAFYGAVSKNSPGEISEGGKSTLDLTITVTNLDGSGVETAPSFS